MSLRVLVVDDEAPARERLGALLAEIPDTVSVGAAANGAEALEMIDELAPDIVLLDVRMPGIDGIEVARRLANAPEPPAVIFTTAYDEYALAAFDAQAVAYLLKPIRREKLAAALAQAPAGSRSRSSRRPRRLRASRSAARTWPCGIATARG